MKINVFVWLTSASLWSLHKEGLAIDFLEPLLTPDFNLTATDPEDPNTGVSGAHKCPDKIEIAWKNSPPFVYKSRVNATGKATEVTGIIHDLLHRAFRICCSPAKPRVAFQEKEKLPCSLSRLLTDHANKILIAPVHSIDGATYGAQYQFIRILNSPGIVLIMSKVEYSLKARNAVWKSLEQAWPIVALTFVLSAIAGIVIWALDTLSNPEHFPRSLFRGVMEGFWWAFVTMSTVGYGDRVPKSLCARLFGVFWIMTGLAVCSILTATLTSALTSISTGSDVSILGQDIGVMEHNDAAYNEGVRQGALMHEFKSQKEMYESLTTISGKDGMLDEMHSGTFYVAKYRHLQLGVAKIFPREVSLGVAFRHGLLLNSTVDCLRKLFLLRENDILRLVEVYRKKADEITESIQSKEKDGAIINLFDGEAPAFQYLMYAVAICFLLLCVVGVYLQVTKCRQHKSSKQQNQDISGKDDEISRRALVNDSSVAETTNVPMETFPSKTSYKKAENDDIEV